MYKLAKQIQPIHRSEDGALKLNLKSFKILSEKTESIIQHCDTIKQDKERIEAQMLKKDRESRAIKKQLEKTLKERDIIKQRLDGIIEKIDSLDLL